MIHWNAEPFIERAIREFCEEALPDAHDLDDLTYSITPDGDKLRIEIDIPTSEMDAWLMLMVDVRGDRPEVSGVSCLRSGTGDGSDDVYKWTSDAPEWTLQPSD